MMNFSRFPHEFEVKRITTDGGYPPIATEELLISGECNVQVGTSGSTENENQAMIYDWLIFYNKELTEKVEVNDIVSFTRDGDDFEATVIRAVKGQLTNRIWCNNVSK